MDANVRKEALAMMLEFLKEKEKEELMTKTGKKSAAVVIAMEPNKESSEESEEVEIEEKSVCPHCGKPC